MAGLVLSFVTSSNVWAQSVPVVLPSDETSPSRHPGDTADDSAIWIHPTDPALSTVIGDDKGGGLMV